MQKSLSSSPPYLLKSKQKKKFPYLLYDFYDVHVRTTTGKVGKVAKAGENLRSFSRGVKL